VRSPTVATRMATDTHKRQGFAKLIHKKATQQISLDIASSAKCASHMTCRYAACETRIGSPDVAALIRATALLPFSAACATHSSGPAPWRPGISSGNWKPVTAPRTLTVVRKFFS